MENDQSTEVVHTAEALGIRGGGDDIDEPSVDYEGSDSEEEEDVETTVRKIRLNANENNDIPVEGSVGATQPDISLGGHDVDKCLNDKENNDIPVEGYVDTNRTDISLGGHGEQTTNGNNESEVDKCLNDGENNDSPV